MCIIILKHLVNTVLLKFCLSVGEDVKEQVGVKVSIKELDDVLMRDVGGKIAESGRYRSLHGICDGMWFSWGITCEPILQNCET